NIVPFSDETTMHVMGDAPTEFSWQLRNTSVESFSWFVDNAPEWLTFGLESGTIPAGDAVDVTAVLDPLAPGFSPGPHEARILFRDAGSSDYRPVDVHVNAWRAIEPGFEDGFESGSLADFWRATGVSQPRATVREVLEPIDSWHLVMDDYMR